jgi:hypothetical protein
VLSFWAAKTAGVIWLNESLFGKVRARVQRIVTVMPDWYYPAILLVSLSAGVLVMALLASRPLAGISYHRHCNPYGCHRPAGNRTVHHDYREKQMVSFDGVSARSQNSP